MVPGCQLGLTTTQRQSAAAQAAHKPDSSWLYQRASLSVKSTYRVALFSLWSEKGKTFTTHHKQMSSHTELLKTVLWALYRINSHLACIQNHTTTHEHCFIFSNKKEVPGRERKVQTGMLWTKRARTREIKKGNICRHLVSSSYLASPLRPEIANTLVLRCTQLLPACSCSSWTLPAKRQRTCRLFFIITFSCVAFSDLIKQPSYQWWVSLPQEKYSDYDADALSYFRYCITFPAFPLNGSISLALLFIEKDKLAIMRKYIP